MEEIRELTKAEEPLMRVLWQLQKAVIKEIAEKMPEPKPAYNTIATVLKVLKGKGFVDYKTVDNAYVYYPLVAEKDYTRFMFDRMFSNYFSGSYKQLVSFLVEEKAMDNDTRSELMKLADKLKED
jgi:BlaI family transcriptional regulator, penicillinase repressor